VGVLERLRNAARANVTDIVARSDDPEGQLDELLKRMAGDLEGASDEIGAAVRDERRLAEELLDHQYQAKVMEDKARLAIDKGEDDLAREALRRKGEYARRAEQLDRELRLQRDGVRALQDHLSALDAKIAETRRYRDMVLARQRLSAAQEGVARKTGAASTEALERIRSTVMELQASTMAAQDELETRLSVIERRAKNGAEDEHIEQELRELRRRRDQEAEGSD